MVVSAVVAVASYIGVLYLPKANRALGLILLTGFWVIVIGVQWVYAINPTFRTYINTFINPSGDHWVSDRGEVSLPLPRKTALSARYSDVSARYYSRLSTDEVVEYYRNQVSGVTIQSVNAEDSGTRLVLFYQGTEYSVSVTPVGKSASHILIEANL
jgi:hypothetical protein